MGLEPLDEASHGASILLGRSSWFDHYPSHDRAVRVARLTRFGNLCGLKDTFRKGAVDGDNTWSGGPCAPRAVEYEASCTSATASKKLSRRRISIAGVHPAKVALLLRSEW